jgi:O-antigen/teichoic acid export membrane protein
MAAFFPAFSHAYASDKSRLGILTSGATKTMATAGFLFVLLGFFLAGPVVIFFFGDTYRQSVPVLRILLLNIPVLFVAAAYHQPLVAFDRRRSWLMAVVAGGISNVIINLTLIPLFGANGAAVATVASTTIVCVIAYFCFIDVVPHNILASIAKPLATAGFLGLLYFFVLEKFTNTLAGACVLSVISVVVYLVVLFLAGGITREELTWLRDEVLKMRVGKNLEV